MILSNYHTHTKYCDGKNTVDEMVQKAIELGYTSLGFSGHVYAYFANAWCMTKQGTVNYINDVAAAREKYKDKINIYCGIEQDYFAMDDGHKYDYVIGSVHRVRTPGGDFAAVRRHRLPPPCVQRSYGPAGKGEVPGLPGAGGADRGSVGARPCAPGQPAHR